MRLALVLAVMLGACRNQTAPAEGPKPTVHVLTSLPLLFGEGFGLSGTQPEATTYLERYYKLEPIDLPSKLPEGGVLLAAQPRALPAEELVALDAWVRRGGRLGLLADPMLEWPSARPLGDRLRPPTSYADTGLLAHWGLRLDAPDVRGLKTTRYNGTSGMTYHSPGRLVKVGGSCTVNDENGISATCFLGDGLVFIVADADWLNVEALRAVEAPIEGNLSSLGGIVGRPVESRN